MKKHKLLAIVMGLTMSSAFAGSIDSIKNQTNNSVLVTSTSDMLIPVQQYCVAPGDTVNNINLGIMMASDTGSGAQPIIHGNTVINISEASCPNNKSQYLNPNNFMHGYTDDSLITIDSRSIFNSPSYDPLYVHACSIISSGKNPLYGSVTYNFDTSMWSPLPEGGLQYQQAFDCSARWQFIIIQK